MKQNPDFFREVGVLFVTGEDSGTNEMSLKLISKSGDEYAKGL
jgi:hypothetical protein